MKTEFELEVYQRGKVEIVDGCVKIIGTKPNYSPYVVMDIKGFTPMFLKDKDLERFAVNILKALKSKKLK